MSAEALHCLNSFPILHARDQQVVSAEKAIKDRKKNEVPKRKYHPHSQIKEALQ